MNITEMEFSILLVMYQKKCLDEFTALTVNEVCEHMNIPKPTLYKKIRKLNKNEYISLGIIKENREKPYFMTEKSVRLINIYIKNQKKKGGM